MRFSLLPFLLGNINFRKNISILYSKKPNLGTEFERPFYFPPELTSKLKLSLTPEFSIKEDKNINTTFHSPTGATTPKFFNTTANPPNVLKKDVNITVLQEIKPKKELKVSTKYIRDDPFEKQMEGVIVAGLQYYIIYLFILTCSKIFLHNHEYL